MGCKSPIVLFCDSVYHFMIRIIKLFCLLVVVTAGIVVLLWYLNRNAMIVWTEKNEVHIFSMSEINGIMIRDGEDYPIFLWDKSIGNRFINAGFPESDYYPTHMTYCKAVDNFIFIHAGRTYNSNSEGDADGSSNRNSLKLQVKVDDNGNARIVGWDILKGSFPVYVIGDVR